VLSFAAQADMNKVPTIAMVAMPPKRVMFTEFPSGIFVWCMCEPMLTQTPPYVRELTALTPQGERKVNAE
jgi:hypothetical protein